MESRPRTSRAYLRNYEQCLVKAQALLAVMRPGTLFIQRTGIVKVTESEPIRLTYGRSAHHLVVGGMVVGLEAAQQNPRLFHGGIDLTAHAVLQTIIDPREAVEALGRAPAQLEHYAGSAVEVMSQFVGVDLVALYAAGLAHEQSQRAQRFPAA